MPLILEDVQPIFPRALLSERSLKPISCLAQNNEVLEPAGRAQLHTSPMKKLWMIYNCKYTHTHTNPLYTQRHGHMPPGGVMDSCILQCQPAGSTVSQSALWALIGQSVRSGAITANHQTVSWRAAPNLQRVARSPFLSELLLAYYQPTTKKSCCLASANRVSVGLSQSYQQITAPLLQPIWALSFPTDVRLVQFREIKLPQQAHFANVAP